MSLESINQTIKAAELRVKELNIAVMRLLDATTELELLIHQKNEARTKRINDSKQNQEEQPNS